MDRPLIGITTGADTSEYQSYAEAIDLAGGRSVFLTPRTAEAGELPETTDRIDALLLAGGKDIHPDYYAARTEPGDQDMTTEELVAAYDMDCEPTRDAYEIPLARTAYDARVPILAICRGFQLFNVAMGGTLVKDIRTGLRHRAYRECDAPEHRPGESACHAVCVEPNSRLAYALGVWPWVVNSRHHQGVTLREASDLFEAVAFAPDGIVEGLEAQGHPWAIAVQWHPERKADSYVHGPCRALFKAFVSAARVGRQVR